MKEFKNQVTEVNVPDMKKSTPGKLAMKPGSYSELALLVVRAPKREGLSVEEMRKRFKIIDTLDGMKDTAVVKLEDADASELQSLVAEFKWDAMHKDIIGFVDYVAKLKTVKK